MVEERILEASSSSWLERLAEVELLFMVMRCWVCSFLLHPFFSSFVLVRFVLFLLSLLEMSSLCSLLCVF